MHPLDGPRLKVQHAKSEIGQLRSLEDAYRSDAEAHLVKAEVNPKSRRQVYRVEGVVPIDPDWGVWVGEIAHNLRSALDGLVYQLALLGGPLDEAETRRTQFPIFLHRYTKTTGGKTVTGFEGRKGAKQPESGSGRDKIRKLTSAQQASIERLQPYKRGQNVFLGHGKRNLLYQLHELNLADKHRLIQVIGAKAAGYWTWDWGDGDPVKDVSSGRFVVLQNGAKFVEANPHLHVDPTITPLISFWQGCDAVQHKGVVYTLWKMANHVGSIVDAFRREFP
jgi:hypothetical protein